MVYIQIILVPASGDFPSRHHSLVLLGLGLGLVRFGLIRARVRVRARVRNTG